MRAQPRSATPSFLSVEDSPNWMAAFTLDQPVFVLAVQRAPNVCIEKTDCPWWSYPRWWASCVRPS